MPIKKVKCPHCSKVHEFKVEGRRTVPQTLTDSHYFVFGAGCACGKYFEFSDEPRPGITVGFLKETPA